MDDRRTRRRLVKAGAIGAAGLTILIADAVVARGPDIGSPYEILLPKFFSPAQRTPPPESAAPAPVRPRRTEIAVGGPPVCVRLCDGAYFPISTGASENEEEALCRGLCPDAATAIYHETNGPDGIKGAVSTTGKPYSELPTALRYRTALDSACTCHRKIAPRYSVAEDPTLRRGDYVMTPQGLVVFEGASAPPHRADDFVAVANVRLPTQQKASLQALQGPHSAGRRGRVRITTP